MRYVKGKGTLGKCREMQDHAKQIWISAGYGIWDRVFGAERKGDLVGFFLVFFGMDGWIGYK